MAADASFLLGGDEVAEIFCDEPIHWDTVLISATGDMVTVPGYVREACIGHGSRGTRVFRCLDVQSGGYVAGKVIRKREHIQKHAREACEREISLHRDLEHPNIVRFHCAYECANYVYIFVEYCEGGSLDSYVEQNGGHLFESEVAAISQQLLEALDYLHSLGIVHRDLKLRNVFIEGGLRVKLGDFGLVGSFSEGRLHDIVGTPNYTAPEIIMQHKAGHGSEVDMWSLGVMVYRMLFGTLPFQRKTLKETFRAIRCNAYSIPEIPVVRPAARDFIMELLAFSYKKRLTAEDAVHHLWISGFRNVFA